VINKKFKNELRRLELKLCNSTSGCREARGGTVGWGTALQAGMSRVPFPMGVVGYFHWHNPSGRTMTLGSTQPLTEMSTRNISWGIKAAGA